MRNLRTRPADDAPDRGATLEIDFDDEGAVEPSERDVPRRDGARAARIVATGLAAATVLGAALIATHRSASAPVPPANGFVVTLTYLGSHVVSVAQHRIEVDLTVTPIQNRLTMVFGYGVSQHGVDVASDPSDAPYALPPRGSEVELFLTVTDCPHVPKDESMAYVDVTAAFDGGLSTDRFTILGERYSTDISRLLHTVCP